MVRILKLRATNGFLYKVRFMSFFEVNILLCAFSLGGMVLFISRRLRLVKDMSEDELYKGIYSSKPFFSFIDIQLTPESVVETARMVKKRFKIFFPEIRTIFLWTRKVYCGFLNRMQGRKVLKSNGCKGYWEKINESKNKTVEK